MHFYRLGILISATVTALGCAPETKYSGGAPTTGNTVDSSASGTAQDFDAASAGAGDGTGQGEQREETFTLGTSRTKAANDVLWLVDTSGSMGEELALVEANIKRFIESMGAVSDLRLAMFVRETGNVSADFSDQFVGKESIARQFNAPIESYDALQYAAAALCTNGGTDRSKICGVDVNVDVVSGGARDLAGSLNGFFRNGTPKSVVVVTDDESTFSASDWNRVIDDSASVSVFAFAVTGETQATAACTPVAEGLIYDSLARQTGGDVYDVCKEDWGDSFLSLQESIQETVKDAVTLKVKPSEIISIELDGQVLSTSEYTIKGRNLTIKRSLDESNSLVVTYRN